MTEKIKNFQDLRIWQIEIEVGKDFILKKLETGEQSNWVTNTQYTILNYYTLGLLLTTILIGKLVNYFIGQLIYFLSLS